jgi:sugar phosphate permease
LTALARVRSAHYAWVVVGITFLALLASAGVRAAPGALIKPFEADFGWDRASISAVVAISILGYGLGAPLSGGLVDRFGPRTVMAGGLALIAAGLAPMIVMSQFWQFGLAWGVATALGTGAVASVIGTTLALRWFRTHRGLVVGLFSAAASMGQLIFLPSMVAISVTFGWRTAIVGMFLVVAALVLPVALLVRNRPADRGLRPVGDDGSDSAALVADRAEDAHRTPLRTALGTRDFWLLASSFFVCGYTSNGLIGTHLIPHAVEHGFSEVTAAGAVGVMGLMNVVGTLASGWLTDRYDNRRLLAAYYAFRAGAIFFLPFVVAVPQLYGFAIVYGLDWIATVPPTANLIASRFGRASVGTIYGWVYFSHMVGAALAAFLGGLFRELLGDYTLVFLSAGALGMIAAGLALSLSTSGRRAPAAPEPIAAAA